MQTSKCNSPAQDTTCCEVSLSKLHCTHGSDFDKLRSASANFVAPDAVDEVTAQLTTGLTLWLLLDPMKSNLISSSSHPIPEFHRRNLLELR